MSSAAERTRKDYIMAGHAFLRVLKPSRSRHELQVSECFIHHYGFAATGERFLMLDEKKGAPPSHPRPSDGVDSVFVRYICQGKAGEGVILSSHACSILVQYSPAAKYRYLAAQNAGSRASYV